MTRPVLILVSPAGIVFGKTRRVFKKATGWIGKMKDGEESFFPYIATTAPPRLSMPCRLQSSS